MEKTLYPPVETVKEQGPGTVLAAANGLERVSVIIPCRNEAERIETVLEAIRVQDCPVHEAIVVDNRSTDQTRAVVERYQRARRGWPLRIVDCSVPGAAAALNAGIRAAEGEIIVRIDGHSQPKPDYVRRCVDALGGGDRRGVVGGVWEIAPGGAGIFARATAQAISHRLGTGGAAYREPHARCGPEDVDTVPFGCFRKSLWAELGGYDDSLLVVEDCDLNYRIRAAGYRVVLDPAIRCTYFARPTLRSLARQYFRYGWWKRQMLKKHPRSLRWRQAVPGALVPTFAILAAASLVAPAAMVLLGVLAAAYLAALAGAAGQIAGRQRRLDMWGPAVAAFGVVHFAWSSGFAVNLVTASRWPAWNGRGRVTETHGQRGFSGATLLGALLAIFVLAFVVPPGLATLVNGSRIDRAQEQVRVLAQEVRVAASSPSSDIQQVADVLGGPGRTPEAPGARAWIEAPLGTLERHVSEGLSPDPWGNRYLVNIGLLKETAPAGSGNESAVWVLSAGPNGSVETAYRLPARSASVGGDDVGERVR